MWSILFNMTNFVRPLRKSDFVAQSLDGELLLYNIQGEQVHVLNPTAQCIWDLCDGEHTIADIEQEIRANFSVPPNCQIKDDIQKTLSVFNQKGLLQR